MTVLVMCRAVPCRAVLCYAILAGRHATCAQPQQVRKTHFIASFSLTKNDHLPGQAARDKRKTRKGKERK